MLSHQKENVESPHAAPARALVAARGQWMLDQTIRLANINSGTRNVAGVSAMRAALVELLAGMGLKAELLDFPAVAVPAQSGKVQFGGGLRVVCRPDAPVTVLLNGHMDTVFEETHPFQKCTFLPDGQLQGPGVADMKGGLVVMLAALAAFEQSPVASKIGWEILITADEETGSYASHDALVEAAGRHTFGLTFESSPPAGTIVRRRMGTGTYVARVKGRNAHSGRDFHNGRNAIILLAEWMQAVHSLNDAVPGAIFNVGRFEGVSPLNVVPDRAAAYIGVRAATVEAAETCDQVMRALEHRFAGREGFSVELEGAINRSPKEVTPGVEQMFAALQACGRQQGLELDWADTGGASDGNILQAAGLPIIDNLGVRGGGLHTPDEFMLPESLVERAQLAASFLVNLADGTLGDPRRFRSA